MKGVIFEVDLYYQIRILYNEGESIRSIARRLNVSRPTVKKYLALMVNKFISKIMINGKLFGLSAD